MYQLSQVVVLISNKTSIMHELRSSFANITNVPTPFDLQKAGASLKKVKDILVPNFRFFVCSFMAKHAHSIKKTNFAFSLIVYLAIRKYFELIN